MMGCNCVGREICAHASGKRERIRSVDDQPRRIMIPDEIAQEAWSVAARHLARGQRDPTKMVAEAIALEQQRCLEIATEFCGESSDVVREIVERRLRTSPIGRAG